VAETIASILENKGSEIWSISPEATVYDAIAMMADKGIGALLIISDGRTGDPVTVTAAHTVDECMRIITYHRVRHLPVMDGDRLLGVISIGDLVNAIIAAQAQTIDHLHTYITSKYPA
jgi:CBS domain-containing protein